MFRVEIETSNAAFANQPGEELASILTEVAEKLRDGLGYAPDATFSGLVRDSNGNNVGMWQYTAE
jgi:hypothetical protein